MRDFLLDNAVWVIAVICVLEAVVAVLLWRARRTAKTPFALLAFMVTLGLLFDAVAILLGSVLPAAVLAPVSRLRFIFHGVLVPLLLPLGAYAMGWTGTKVKVVWIVTALIMAAGLYMGCAIVLEPTNVAGITRYQMGEGSPAIVTAIEMVITFGTVIPLLAAGVVTLAKKRGPWVLVGALAMFAFSALGPATGNLDLNFLITMFGELAMVFCFWLYARKE